MKNSEKILIGVVLGGAAAVLFLSSKKGKPFCKNIRSKADEILNNAGEKVHFEKATSSFDDAADKILNFAVNNRETIAGFLVPIFSKIFEKK